MSQQTSGINVPPGESNKAPKWFELQYSDQAGYRHSGGLDSCACRRRRRGAPIGCSRPGTHRERRRVSAIGQIRDAKIVTPGVRCEETNLINRRPHINGSSDRGFRREPVHRLSKANGVALS